MASNAVMDPLPTRSRDRSMSFPPTPVHSDLFKRRAVVSLDIIVVGAGLSGLSAAYNLRQAGHNVRVLEKRPGKPETQVYSGLRCPPNLSKLLQHWGLGERLREKAISCPKIDFVDGASGQRLSSIIYHPALVRELQADMYGICYKDLYDMCYDICVESNIPIEFSSHVIDIDPDTPAVMLADGQILDADLIVGADGIYSVVRAKVPEGDEPLVHGRYSNYTLLVETKEMEKDDLLAPLLKDGTWTLWMGNNSCSLNYRVSDEYYLASVFYDHLHGRGKDAWAVKVPTESIDASEYEERVQRLMKLGKVAIPTQHVKPPKIEDWYSEDGKIVLVGEAVHPDSPDSTNGAALNIEDGAVLGSLFSRLQTRSQDEILRLLRAYQEIREERCAQTIKSDTELCVFSCLPPGPGRDARDEGFKKAEENQNLDWEEGEDALRGAWDEFKGSFGYEAYDAADDWWVDWGVMIQRMAAANNMTALSSTTEASTSLDDSASRLSGLFSNMQTTITEVTYESD